MSALSVLLWESVKETPLHRLFLSCSLPCQFSVWTPQSIIARAWNHWFFHITVLVSLSLWDTILDRHNLKGEQVYFDSCIRRFNLCTDGGMVEGPEWRKSAHGIAYWKQRSKGAAKEIYPSRTYYQWPASNNQVPCPDSTFSCKFISEIIHS